MTSSSTESPNAPDTPVRSTSINTRSRRLGKQPESVTSPMPSTSSNAIASSSANVIASTANTLAPHAQEHPQSLELKENLINDIMFLGNENLTSHVAWIEDGRQHKLVDLNALEEELKSPAVLQWVGEISPNDFWLYACGGWNGGRGPNDDWLKISLFEKAKARGRIRKPDWDLFASHWDACIDNLNKLMMSAKKRESKTAYSLIDGGEIKVRHCIFQSTEDNDLEVRTLGSNESSELGEEFAIENMPCRFEKARDALADIIYKGGYDFNPIPVISLKGKAVPPMDYERRLSGATVLISVTLSYEYYSTKGYQFYADIDKIVILRPPKSKIALPTSKLPSKKCRFELPDVVPSPVKRRNK